MMIWLLGAAIVLLILISLLALALYYLNNLYRKPFIRAFNEKSVFITGTDTGFGKLLSLSLDRKGVKVYAGCYTKEGAEDLRTSASKKLRVIQLDVTDVASIVRAKELIEADLPPGQDLWGVVNNAGTLKGILFGLSTIQDYRDVMEVNFFGIVNVNEIFAPLLKRSAGRIVNVISILGRINGIAEPYCCSKYAMEPYNDGLRRWMRKYGVCVAAIEPGLFPTSMTSCSFTNQDLDRSWKNLSPELREEYGENYIEIVKKSMNRQYRPLANYNSPNMVTRAITHALFAVHPKDRYVCGLDARFLYRFIPYLPDWMVDFGLRIVFPF